MSWNPSLEPGVPTKSVRRDRDPDRAALARPRRLRGPARLPAPKSTDGRAFIFFDQAVPRSSSRGMASTCGPIPISVSAPSPISSRAIFHHRDSTGADQVIRPGALNWMVAGRGVTHSERTSANRAERTEQPVRHPDMAGPPGQPRGCRTELRASWHGDAPGHRGSRRLDQAYPGTAYGKTAPATMLSETFYADVRLETGSRLRCRTTMRIAASTSSRVRSRSPDRTSRQADDGVPAGDGSRWPPGTVEPG